MFNYYKKGICDKDFINKNSKKFVIVFDKFNKIFIIQFNKNEDKPSVIDLDLKIYPKTITSMIERTTLIFFKPLFTFYIIFLHICFG